MGRNIKEMPSKELLADYLEISADALMCMLAMSMELMEYGDGECIHCRLENNMKMMMQIRTELMRREDPIGYQLEKTEPKYG